MKRDRVSYDNWHFKAKLERGALVPYGSTFVPLPDEWDMNWKGYVVVDVGREWLQEEWTEQDLKDKIQECLEDEPYHISSSNYVFIRKWTELKRMLPQVMIEVEDVEFH